MPSETDAEEPVKTLMVEDALDRALIGLSPRRAGLMRCMYDFDRDIDPTQQEVHLLCHMLVAPGHPVDPITSSCIAGSSFIKEVERGPVLRSDDNDDANDTAREY